MYTQGSSQQTFEIPNNNLDVKFEKAYPNHNNKIRRTRKENKISHNGKVSKHNDSDAQDVFRPIPGLFSCAVTSTRDKIL